MNKVAAVHYNVEALVQDQLLRRLSPLLHPTHVETETLTFILQSSIHFMPAKSTRTGNTELFMLYKAYLAQCAMPEV